tara:strand:- start:974 stop:1315 length:342 start_codon:yes stop_codon:yes gene_type:complete
MGTSQRNKGKRGERAFAALCREHGFHAHRSQQYCGAAGDSDVVTPALPIHWEVKHVERLNIHAAYLQAKDDSQSGSYPVVAFKRNHSPWLVTLSAEDLFDILRQSDVVQSNTQ